LKLAEVFSEVYGVDVDKDLVLAAAVLHDLYKFYQYEKLGDLYAVRRDWFVEHNYALVAELAVRKCREDLVEVVAGAHSRTPLTRVEQLIVHLADLVDASFVEKLQNMLIEQLQHAGCAEPLLVLARMLSSMSIGELLRSVKEGGRGYLEKICRERQTIDPSSQPG